VKIDLYLHRSVGAGKFLLGIKIIPGVGHSGRRAPRQDTKLDLDRYSLNLCWRTEHGKNYTFFERVSQNLWRW